MNQTGTRRPVSRSPAPAPLVSGGTIQNITNRGASFINAVNVSLTDMNFTNANTTDGGKSDGVIGSNTDENAAINLQNVTQVDLTDLVIDGTAQHGINGSNVTDLDITNTTIQNTGDEVWESNIYLWDLKGLASAARTSVFSGLNLTNDSGQFNIWIQNNDGTNDRPGEKDRVEISNSTFTRNGNNALISDNISVFNSGTGNTQVVVSNSTFTATATCGSPAFAGACVSDNIQVDAGNSCGVRLRPEHRQHLYQRQRWPGRGKRQRLGRGTGHVQRPQHRDERPCRAGDQRLADHRRPRGLPARHDRQQHHLDQRERTTPGRVSTWCSKAPGRWPWT